MLMFSLAVFTLVAVMGLSMACDVFKSRGTPKLYALVHGGMALFGSALVIIAALQGDNRVFVNIGLAVAIIAVGIYISFQRAKGIHPKALVALHGGTAVVCYLILAYFALGR